MSGNKILVTGSAGFIGFHFSRNLLEDGFEVLGIDNMNDYYDPFLKEARLAELEYFDNFTFKKVDITNKNLLTKTFIMKKVFTSLFLLCYCFTLLFLILYFNFKMIKLIFKYLMLENLIPIYSLVLVILINKFVNYIIICIPIKYKFSLYTLLFIVHVFQNNVVKA